MGFLKLRILYKIFCAKLWQKQGTWYDLDPYFVYTCLEDSYILWQLLSIQYCSYTPFLKQNFQGKNEAVTLAAAKV